MKVVPLIPADGAPFVVKASFRIHGIVPDPLHVRGAAGRWLGRGDDMAGIGIARQDVRAIFNDRFHGSE